MNLDTQKALGLKTAASIFGLVALGHLLRLFIGFDFIVGTWQVPLWVSILAVFVTGALSLWLFRLSRGM